MEVAGKRCSVLAKAEVREKMMKEIDQISEVFSLSKSDATVILIRLRWNSFKASDLLGDNKEKFLAELGLVQVFDSDQNESNSSSADHVMNGDGDNLVSTPFCSHKFSTTCWSEYLTDALEKNKEERGVISCLNQDCVASVGPDTIEKLTEQVKEMYGSYILETFMECNKATIKWCPASGCGYAIELQEDKEDNFGVVCLCGHAFCWTCQLESHRPVTCKNASLWWTDLLDLSRSISWIHTNTKRCPNCNSHVQQNGDPDYRLITCICSYRFCWICLRSEEEHNGKWNCTRISVPAVDSTSSDFNQILHLNQWEAGQEELEKSKSKLKAFEERIIPKLIEVCGVSEQDIRTVRAAWMLVIQCRQVLKWSCVFDYFLTEYQCYKKRYLNHRREQAIAMLCKHEGTLHELMNRALSAEDFNCFKHIFETSTTNIGNYFEQFAKDLEDGMAEVKGEAYEDGPSSHWFCGRCTFENSLVDKHCKVCFAPPESPPPHAASDDNNSASVSDHEQVPNMPMNPVAAPDEDLGKSN